MQCIYCNSSSEENYPFVEFFIREHDEDNAEFIDTACFECFKDSLVSSYSIADGNHNHQLLRVIETEVRIQRDYLLFAHYLFFMITAFIPAENDPRFRIVLDENEGEGGASRCIFDVVHEMFDGVDFAQYFQRYESWPEKYKITAFQNENPLMWIKRIVEWIKTDEIIHLFFKDAIEDYYHRCAKEEIEFIINSFFENEDYYNSDFLDSPAFRSIAIEILDDDQLGGTCSICLEDFKVDDLVKTLKCKHMFHADELDKWGEKSRLCPYCRS